MKTKALFAVMAIVVMTAFTKANFYKTDGPKVNLSDGHNLSVAFHDGLKAFTSDGPKVFGNDSHNVLVHDGPSIWGDGHNHHALASDGGKGFFTDGPHIIA